jgi:DNA-binding LacI/PurR family transcriptional regulator
VGAFVSKGTVVKRYMTNNFLPNNITIRDIARLAGVSTATVSNVINGKGRVSKTTADRVSEIIRQVNFNVNASARTLRQRTSRIIGVLVPLEGDGTFSFNPYYWQFVDGVMQIADKYGYDVILRSVSNDSNLNVIQERNLDGIIAVGAYDDLPFTQRVISSGVPFVFVDSYIQNPETNLVNLDDRFGGYLATRHVLGLGHSKILFVSGALRPNGVDHERYLGYQRALAESGCDHRIEPIQTDVSLESGRVLAHQLAYQMSGFTAIVTAADALAMGLVRGFKECGIAIPQQVSIVGFDNITESAFSIPSITTIHQDVQEKGRRAGQRLIELMDETEESEPQYVRLTPKLVIRESTAALNSELR